MIPHKVVYLCVFFSPLARGDGQSEGGLDDLNEVPLSEQEEVNKTCSISNAFHVVLLGETGVGKSTFGNYILGVDAAEGFLVGNGADSVTVATESKLGRLLGKDDQPCLMITDTPGLGDTECRDEKHMKGIIESIMDHQKVDMFVLVFRSNDNRFNSGIQRMIHFFEKLLGDSFYKSLAIEFTFFRHDARSRLIRSLSNISKEQIASEWNTQLRTRYAIDEDIPTMFIDPKYVAEISDEEEKKIQEDEINTFLSTLNTNRTYNCESHCLKQLTAWHKMLQPTIPTESQSAKKKTQIRLECSVWYQSHCQSSKNSSPSLSWLLQSNGTNITIVDNPSYEVDWIVDSLTPISRSTVKFNLTEGTEGDYFCVYGSQASEKSSVSMIMGPRVDGVWTSWSTWTQCTWRNATYMKQRHRHCNLPKNRGSPCDGSHIEYQDCEASHEEMEICFNPGYTWSFFNNLIDIVRDSKTAWDCRKSCLGVESCKGYTWFDEDENDPTNSLTCKLFSKLGKAIKSTGVSGKRQCTCSVPFKCNDFYNKNTRPIYFFSTPSEQSCQDLCIKTEDCEWYTWYDSTSFNRYQCLLYQYCKTGQPCTDCHSGHKSCQSICGNTYTTVLNEASRHVKNSVQVSSFSTAKGTEPNENLRKKEEHDRYGRRIHSSNTLYAYFTGEAGTQMPTFPPPPGSCGSTHPGWLNGTYPTIPGTEATEKVCFVGDDDPCKWSHEVKITNCGWGYGFVLKSVPEDNLVYCGV